MDTRHSPGAGHWGPCCAMEDSGKFRVVARYKCCFPTSTQVFQYFNNSFGWPLCTSWTRPLSTTLFPHEETEVWRRAWSYETLAESLGVSPPRGSRSRNALSCLLVKCSSRSPLFPLKEAMGIAPFPPTSNQSWFKGIFLGIKQREKPDAWRTEVMTLKRKACLASDGVVGVSSNRVF